MHTCFQQRCITEFSHDFRYFFLLIWILFTLHYHTRCSTRQFYMILNRFIFTLLRIHIYFSKRIYLQSFYALIHVVCMYICRCVCVYLHLKQNYSHKYMIDYRLHYLCAYFPFCAEFSQFVCSS